MCSFGFRVFHPLDLETIDRVYAAAWAQIIARDPFRNTNQDSDVRQRSASGCSRLQGTAR